KRTWTSSTARPQAVPDLKRCRTSGITGPQRSEERVTPPVTGRRTIWTMIETLRAGIAGVVLGGAVVAAVMIARQGRLSGDLEVTRRVAAEREAGLVADADRLSARLAATRPVARERET